MPLNPAKASTFILRHFGDQNNGFGGVALRQAANGAMSAMQMYDLPGDGQFTVPGVVLEKLLARGIAATAFLGGLAMFTNMCDGGLQEYIALRIARDAFGVYMPVLFEQYGVADFFERDTDSDEE